MLLFTLIDLWRKYAAVPLSRTQAQGKIHFVRFEICDPHLGLQIRQWMVRDQKAREAIECHLNALIPEYRRIDQLLYARDIDGYLDRITFCGETPEGWGQVEKGSSLLKPVSREAMRAVRALPCASREDLHRLVAWPTIDPKYLPSQQKGQARLANRLLRPQEENGRIYISAPHPDNFKESSPVICTLLHDWRPPEAVRKAEMSPQP